MAIDITKDKLISLEDAAKMFPKPGGGHIHPKTVKNWITVGYQGIKLEGAPVGSKFYTTTDALRLFSTQLNERRQSVSQEFQKPDEAAEKASLAPADPRPASEFLESGDDYTLTEGDTVAPTGALTVEIPYQPASRESA